MSYHRATGSYKEILKEAVDGYPFGTPGYAAEGSTFTYSDEVSKLYEEKKTALDKAWSESKKSKWEIAKIVHEICVTGAYMGYDKKYQKLRDEWTKEHKDKGYRENPYSSIGGMATMSNPIIFYTFVKEEYGICRTDLYNMLAVVEEFGHPDGTMTVEASYFTFSQLVEMLPLTYQQRKAIQPNWTIAEIRTYKKSLNTVQTSGQAEEEKNDEQKEPKNDRYARFEKLTRADLCERIIELEEKLKKYESYIGEKTDTWLNKDQANLQS